jgi:hypothetical protein
LTANRCPSRSQSLLEKGNLLGNRPIEQPTKFDLNKNLKTAKALGLTIPQSLVLRADEATLN